MHNIENIQMCFILGIDQRSGTNYTFRLLKEHPDCVGPGPIWEDHIVESSYLLKDFVNLVYSRWNPKWQVENRLGGRELLSSYLGEGIVHFMKYQIKSKLNKTNIEQREREKLSNAKVVLTKMPNVEGIDNFFDFFPNSKLILLVRDGRSVIESGVRSFGWSYEKGFSRWNKRAKLILNFMKNNESQKERFILVKYEDLVSSENETLSKIFKMLDLDGTKFDFKSIENLAVTGSSELIKEGNEVHWQHLQKSEDFNPLNRFNSWSLRKHSRFNWLAGDSMIKLGYDLRKIDKFNFYYYLYNKIKDVLNLPYLIMVMFKRYLLKSVIGLSIKNK